MTWTGSLIQMGAWFAGTIPSPSHSLGVVAFDFGNFQLSFLTVPRPLVLGAKGVPRGAHSAELIDGLLD